MNNNISEETKKKAWEDARFPCVTKLQKNSTRPASTRITSLLDGRISTARIPISAGLSLTESLFPMRNWNITNKGGRGESETNWLRQG